MIWPDIDRFFVGGTGDIIRVTGAKCSLLIGSFGGRGEFKIHINWPEKEGTHGKHTRMVIQQAFVQLHVFHPEKVSDFINKTGDLLSGKHTKNYGKIHHAINRKTHYFYGHVQVRFFYVYQAG